MSISVSAVTPAQREFGFRAAALSIVALVVGANAALPILTVYQTLWGFYTGGGPLLAGSVAERLPASTTLPSLDKRRRRDK